MDALLGSIEPLEQWREEVLDRATDMVLVVSNERQQGREELKDGGGEQRRGGAYQGYNGTHQPIHRGFRKLPDQ